MIIGPRRRSRTGLSLALWMAICVALLLVSRTDQAVAVQDVTARLLSPIHAAVTGVVDGIGGALATVGEIDRLRRDNALLRQRLVDAQEREVALEEARHENEQLRELLGVREALPFELLPVSVISRDPSNFTREIGIDAGTDDGVEAGAVVIGGGGTATLIGRVTEAADDRARVLLIVDTRSAVIGLDQQTRAVGIVRGRLGDQLVFSDVPVTEELGVGDAVLTAGLEVSTDVGSRFPAGLFVGRILDVEEDPNGLTHTAFVEPAGDFNRLERLMVILVQESGE